MYKKWTKYRPKISLIASPISQFLIVKVDGKPDLWVKYPWLNNYDNHHKRPSWGHDYLRRTRDKWGRYDVQIKYNRRWFSYKSRDRLENRYRWFFVSHFAINPRYSEFRDFWKFSANPPKTICPNFHRRFWVVSGRFLANAPCLCNLSRNSLGSFLK